MRFACKGVFLLFLVFALCDEGTDVKTDLGMKDVAFTNDVISAGSNASEEMRTLTYTTGSCCLPDEQRCVEVSEYKCKHHKHGTYGGDGSKCSVSNCPESFGGCCNPQPDGECFLSRESFCDKKGGHFAGLATTCEACHQDPTPRPTSTGACCDAEGGTCTVVKPQFCKEGVFQGVGSKCNNDTCLLMGACCRTVNGEKKCFRLKKKWCLRNGGDFNGSGTVCEDGTCNDKSPTPSPTPAPLTVAPSSMDSRRGGCCLPFGDSKCEFLTQEVCAERQGEYIGDGERCSTFECSKMGACYDEAKGTCGQNKLWSCDGVFLGRGTECYDYLSAGRYLQP